MSSELAGTSLGHNWASTYERDHFTCVYCGFDGRTFDGWMQLSIDHVLPRSSGGGDDPNNLVVACRACNCITSRMSFPTETPRDQIVEAKRNRVKERRKDFYTQWLEKVAPRYLHRPSPTVAPAVPSETPQLDTDSCSNQ